MPPSVPGSPAEPSTPVTMLTMKLENNTGLSAESFTIYVLGFTPTSKKMLYVADPINSKIASFVKISLNQGTLPAYKLGDEIKEVQVNIPASFSDDDKIDGARIYFFVADNSKFSAAPSITYSENGSKVVNVLNPPNDAAPPYSFCEFTVVDTGYGPVIDVQTVDGFTLPVTITLTDKVGVGQSPDISRLDIMNSYAPFINALGPGAAPFLDMQYALNSGGLLNPGLFLTAKDSENQLLNLDSKLNGWFDAELDILFKNTKLSVQGVQGGSGNDMIAPDIYTVSSINAIPIPNNTKLSHPALQFEGAKNKEKFTVFNPVGLCTMSYAGSNGQIPITGVLSDATLEFTNPLPLDTNLQVGMYVTGAGVDPNFTTIQSITTGNDGITSVTLTGSQLKGKTPNAQFGFSKIPDMFMTSGAMVFANAGVFAYAPGLKPEQQVVQLNIQNQIVSALNRGVANSAPASGNTGGYTSAYWGTQTNWYPEGTVQNLFSLFMHTGTVTKPLIDPKTNQPVQTVIPIFIQAEHSTTCARGTRMGQAYGFAYDENAGPTPPAPEGQPEVPSKFDPLPKETSELTITLGAW